MTGHPRATHLVHTLVHGPRSARKSSIRSMIRQFVLEAGGHIINISIIATGAGGWRIVASAAELETNFEFEDLSEGDKSGDESDYENDDGNGDDEGGSSDDGDQ